MYKHGPCCLQCKNHKNIQVHPVSQIVLSGQLLLRHPLSPVSHPVSRVTSHSSRPPPPRRDWCSVTTWKREVCLPKAFESQTCHKDTWAALCSPPCGSPRPTAHGGAGSSVLPIPSVVKRRLRKENEDSMASDGFEPGQIVFVSVWL